MNPSQSTGKAFLGILDATGKLVFSLSWQSCTATTLSITHDMASAHKISDYIAMLYKGKIIWVGKTSEIDSSGESHVDQCIHGRAEGPIQMELRRL